MADPRSLYDQPIQARTIDGASVHVDEWRGKVALAVNVASKCGYTPQYAGLESLHQRFAPRGLLVLGFPCDQFGHQEPDDEAAIRSFCTTTYGVTFPMFSKIDVNGRAAHPLFEFLKAAAPGPLGFTRILWNFTKFLVGRDGHVIARFSPRTEPASLATAIERALG
jgi:glutathione peroxidase